MSPLTYGPGFVPPWRPGLAQARCRGKNCAPGHVGNSIVDALADHHQPPGVGKLVVAITLDSAGLCATCARTAASVDLGMLFDREAA